MRAQLRSARRANLAAGPVAFSLLNEPPAERAKVTERLDAWFDRWLGA